MEIVLLDTSFLVDFERELKRATPGRAHVFLRNRPAVRLVTTITVAGELAAGATLGEEALWEDFLEPFTILPVTRKTAWHYGRIFHHLRSTGTPIGANDIWIAAVGVERGLPLVTDNRGEFERVPNLLVEPY